MKTLFLLLLAICDVHLSSVQAIKFNIQTRTTRRQLPSRFRRADVTDQLVNTSNGSVPVANTLNAEYIANITVGSRVIPVLLDTGSSDLWVTGSVDGSKDTGQSVKLEYAVGEASGNVFKAPVTFDNYTVPDQAFLIVPNASSFSIDIKAQGFEGLIGLGPNSGSVIQRKAKFSNPDSFLDRVFSQNATTSNYITLLLDRQGTPTGSVTGQLTISELVAGFQGIIDQPKLSVVKVLGVTDADQHFQILLDKGDGLIGPDGQPIVAKSIVPKAPSGRLVAVLDSGFTLPQVSRSISDAIYGRVQGAVYDTKNQLWTIPCDQELNITFKFGGVPFPIHPLDVSSSDFSLQGPTGLPVCAGAFQPITSAFSLLGEYDMILGMGFLRNAYSLYDFGNFVSKSRNDRNNPFVQMLPLTDPAKAHVDFVKARLNGVDTTGSPGKALLPASQGQKSPESSQEKKQHLEGQILRRWPYIFLGCLVIFLGSLGLCIWRCCRNRRAKASSVEPTLPLGAVRNSIRGSTYRTLEEPAIPVAQQQQQKQYQPEFAQPYPPPPPQEQQQQYPQYPQYPHPQEQHSYPQDYQQQQQYYPQHQVEMAQPHGEQVPPGYSMQDPRQQGYR